MIGSIRWNIGLGVIGFILSFMASYSNNIFVTTLLRGVYGFLFMFGFTFIVRWLLGTVAGLSYLTPPSAETESQEVGRNVDLITPPDEDSMQDLLRANAGGAEPEAAAASFSPLQPPKLVSHIKEEKPEDLANAIRRLTEE